MVAIQWGALAARALFFTSTHPHQHAVDNSAYPKNAQDAAKALQEWYDQPSGLWKTTGWWNSANCLTVLGDLALADDAVGQAIGIKDIFQNTFYNAQKTVATADKLLGKTGMFISTYKYEEHKHKSSRKRKAQGFPKFLNNFYDDEGWWGLALVRGWDATGDAAMLTAAQTIFDDMAENGIDSTCGGGIWWSKDKKYKNAIANELFIALGASLASRVPLRKDSYIRQTVKNWNWFKQSGMINDKGLINDGLKITDKGCVNNGMQTWSYNQGVILGGLVELSKVTGDQSFLAEAVTIANAALKALQDEKGIIREIDRCEPNCGDDGSQFKGIFVRNLAYLHKVAPHDNFRDAILKNADSIWAHNRNSKNQLGINWAGPAEAGKGPTAATHSSAMDVLVGALAAIKY
ncbi:glycosyl hydrolase family 76-domain-containing protein [Neurospora tetraspora]|uniref:Glycosyl hydrolase family 76-domain-containing protein n=1 Tax=Neurospora tetraspora TaxID=94610 RepID=A0AAE0J7E0_9PEZI|nr:glycosyl hydrolase family 76-domain-containing protein [Neurospora tetraspora]